MEKEDDYNEWCNKYDRTSQSLKIMYQLKKMHENKEMCDFIIKSSDGKEFYVHKLIIHTSIPYFNSFNQFYTYDNGNQNVVTLNMLSSKAIDLIINYIYNGTIDYYKDNILEIIYAADYLQMESLKSKAITELFNFENKEMLFNDKLMSIIEMYIKKNEKAQKFYGKYFCEFSEKESFCLLGIKSLICILDKDYLNVPNEEFVYDCAMKWMYYDYENRKQFILNIISILRIAFLNYSFIFDKLLTQKIIINNDITRKNILEYVRICLDGSSRIEYIKNYSPERDNYQLTCIILDKSYSDNVVSVNIKKFIQQSKTWKTYLFEIFHKTDYIIGIKYKNKIYFVECDENEYYEHGIILDIDNKSIKRKIFSSNPRSGRTIGQFEDKIFTIGGIDMDGRNNLVESYNFKDNKITSLQPIPNGVTHATSIVIGNHIYIIGGKLEQPLRTIKRYFILANLWEELDEMFYPRFKTSAIVYKKQIFVIGGKNYNGILNNCEVYDIETKRWSIIPNMPYKRAGATLSIRQNFLHVVGGYGEASQQIMQYDLLQNKWYEGPVLEDSTLMHIAI